MTILAPYEQSQPTEYPGLRTGDETKAMSLFDLRTTRASSRTSPPSIPTSSPD